MIVLGLAFFQKELLGVGQDIYNSSFNATAWLGSAAGYLIITLPDDPPGHLPGAQAAQRPDERGRMMEEAR